MWGIVKTLIVIAVVVFLVQLLMSGITTVLNTSGPTTQGPLRASGSDQQAQYHKLPETDLRIFVPKSVYRIVTEAVQALESLFQDVRRAVIRALPSRI